MNNDGRLKGMDVFSFFQEFIRENRREPTEREMAKEFHVTTTLIKEKMVAVQAELEKRLSSYVARLHSAEVNGSPLPDFKYTGPRAKGLDLSPFTGREGGLDKKLQELYWEDSRNNVYLEGTVDYYQHEEQIVLNDQTMPEFYDPSKVRIPKYVKGTRRFLEKITREVTADCACDRARALNLVRWISNLGSNPYKHRVEDWVYFVGGTEEEVIKKGELMCNEVARVLCFLSQILGMPARILFHLPAIKGAPGHACTEIFFEGKWNWFDETSGFGILRKDGYFANTWELCKEPELVDSLSFVGLSYIKSSLFTGLNRIVPYDIDGIDHYSYIWQSYSRQ